MQATDLPGNTGSDLPRALVIARDPQWREKLSDAFQTRGLAVTPVDSYEEAARWIESDAVDLVVTDLASATAADSRLMRTVRTRRAPVPVVVTIASRDADTISSLRNANTDVLQHPFDDAEVSRVVERALASRLRHADTLVVLPFATEQIDFTIPSRVEYLDGLLSYLTERLVRMGIMQPQSTNVVIALDEAIVNAIKHGNGYDETKRVTISARLSCEGARFTVTDEGPGFQMDDVPDPCAPENLLRASGRGLLLIRNIMDEVSFNGSGNSVTMFFKSEPQPDGAPSGECS